MAGVSKDGLALGQRAGVISCWEERAEIGNRMKKELPENLDSCSASARSRYWRPFIDDL